jgi:hypothetical protein
MQPRALTGHLTPARLDGYDRAAMHALATPMLSTLDER